MKNANLIVNGQPAGAVDLESFDRPEALVAWEFASYDAYGQEACNRDGIWTIADLYGEEFAQQFTARHSLLLAQHRLGELLAEQAELAAAIERIQTWLANPSPAYAWKSYSNARTD